MDSMRLKPRWALTPPMVLQALGRIMQVEKGRTLLYISRKVVGDSAWPFEAGERVSLTVDPKTKQLIIEKLPKVGRKT